MESKKIRLPKLKWIAMKKHREPAEGLRLKSVTVSMEPSGKYFASLLYEDTAVKTKQLNQTIVLQRYLE